MSLKLQKTIKEKLDTDVVTIKFEGLYKLLDSVHPSVGRPSPVAILNWDHGGRRSLLVHYFQRNKPHIIFQRVFYSNSKQRNMKNVKAWSQHSEGKGKLCSENWMSYDGVEVLHI